MASAPRLPTRSHAILGLLAIRDWTTYELARQMERGVGDIWSAARSMVYAEPKRLVGRGLARARVELVGRRARTRYAITPRGRRSVDAWLAAPSTGPALEFEGLLKVLLADLDRPDHILATLAEARAWADELQATGRTVAEEYTAGVGPFPEREPVVALTFAFLWDFAELVRHWASWAEGEVQAWPDEGRAHRVFERAVVRGRATPPGRRAPPPSSPSTGGRGSRRLTPSAGP